MAARICSQEGHRVCLIDKKKTAGNPVQCAEAVSRFALEANGLAMDQSWVKWVVQGIKIHCPNGKYFFVSKGTHLCLRRDVFDGWLVQQAVREGADLRLQTTVVGVSRENNTWQLKTDKESLRAKILVAADGPGSRIARWTGLLKRREYLKALQFTFEESENDRFEDNSLNIYKWAKHNPGYIWVFPRGDEYNVGIGGYAGLPSQLSVFCESMGFDARRKTRECAGLIPRRYIFERYAGHGLVVVGDAAGLTNPIHGGGIYQALLSGRLAGEAAHQALNEGSLSLLSTYEKRIRGHAILDPCLYRTSRILESWDDELFNLAGTLFNGKLLTVPSLPLAFKTFLKDPRYIRKIPEFREVLKGFRRLHAGW
jgi:digeranylgeranylglycerophospholipid reductase